MTGHWLDLADTNGSLESDVPLYSLFTCIHADLPTEKKMHWGIACTETSYWQCVFSQYMSSQHSSVFTTILVVFSNMHFMPTQFKVSWTRIGDYIIQMYARLLRYSMGKKTRDSPKNQTLDGTGTFFVGPHNQIRFSDLSRFNTCICLRHERKVFATVIANRLGNHSHK